MDWIKIILLINILWMGGCAGSKAMHRDKLEPLTMKDIYFNGTRQAQKDVAAFIESNLQEQKTYGYVKPYVPVVNDPVVRKVWVPDHKSSDNADVVIAGHWVYVMVQPFSWFIDSKAVNTEMPIIVPSLGKNNTD